MSVVAFHAPDEREIVEEIRAWSAHALEKNSPAFGGLPPCPYAKKAWADNRVAIVFKYGGNQCLFNILTEFHDAFDLVIVVDRHVRQSAEAFHDFNDGLNDAISRGIFGDRDLWVMGFHPEDDGNDLVDDGTFQPLVDEPYAMTFVQRLTKVQEAADKLRQMGYYDAYLSEYDASELFEKRATLYRRLKDGNEPS